MGEIEDDQIRLYRGAPFRTISILAIFVCRSNNKELFFGNAGVVSTTKRRSRMGERRRPGKTVSAECFYLSILPFALAFF